MIKIRIFVLACWVAGICTGAALVGSDLPWWYGSILGYASGQVINAVFSRIERSVQCRRVHYTPPDHEAQTFAAFLRGEKL